MPYLFDYTKLDPGIRSTVALLHTERYMTTDSGDGVTKPPEERTIDLPHVVIVGRSQLRFDRDVRAMRQAVDHLHQLLGPDWLIEGTYCIGGPNKSVSSTVITVMRTGTEGR